MRLITVILACTTCVAVGQGVTPASNCSKALDTLTNREIYKTDTEAKAIDGVAELFRELAAVKLPKDPDTHQINLYISILVEPNGDIADLRTVGKVQNSTLEKELLPIFRKYKWEPGRCNGVKVPTRLILRVVS